MLKLDVQTKNIMPKIPGLMGAVLKPAGLQTGFRRPSGLGWFSLANMMIDMLYWAMDLHGRQRINKSLFLFSYSTSFPLIIWISSTKYM